MIARSNHWIYSLLALTTLVGGPSLALACEHCNGGGGGGGRTSRSFSSFAHEDYGVAHGGGGCGSCGSARCRDASCVNEPRGCRNCPPNPDKVDCCNPCSRKRVFGCGWRTWDLLGYWGCGNGCADGQGCGEIYRGDYASDPPACCDPCDGHGNWIGPGSGYRARYNPGHYVGETYYDSSFDYSYAGGRAYQEPARFGGAARSQANSTPSRLVPSTARNVKTHQAWQAPRSATR